MLRYTFSDCSGLSETGKCTWLAIKSCRGEKCNFKRTTEEYINSLKYVYQRLSSLDLLMQIKIAKKYYRGSMPWNGTKVVE